MLKAAVLASGGGTNLQAIIDRIEDGYLDCQIVKVVASRDDAFAVKRAEKHNIPWDVIKRKAFQDSEEFSMAMIRSVEESGADLVILAGYLTILDKSFINRFRNKIINVHPSLIPSFCGKGYYGLRVHEEALKAGVKVSGATVHFVDENADTGPIILQKAVSVQDDDDAEALQKRVMEEAEWIILPEAVKLFSEKKLQIEGNRVKVREDLQ